jgi:acetyl esterase/lipase
MKMAGSLWALLIVATGLMAGSSLAQIPIASSMFKPVATPDQSDAIALRPANTPVEKPRHHTKPQAEQTEPPAEQWEDFHGERIVRNVTQPTLTPFLPDASNATGAAVIVAPGGGFIMLSMDNAGNDVARWFASHGTAAFVLKYRPRETPAEPSAFVASLASLMRQATVANADPLAVPAEALDDAKAAVHLIRERASSWNIDPNRVGFVGFSAGAILTVAMGLTEDKSVRPDFIAPIYGQMTAQQVPADAPPMFVALAMDDPLMAKGKSLDLIASWRSAGRPIEAHLYERGGHGFGMSNRSAASGLWIDEFYAWMKDRGLLKPAR